jgi:hemoglobin-like flavoprotein
MQPIEESLHEILRHGKAELGGVFYARLFESHPETQVFFRNVDLDVQANLLINALHIVVSHGCHRFPATESYLKILGNRHHQRQIPIDMYARFCDVLLNVLEDFHGDDWNPELAKQWRDAFDLTMEAMIAGHVDGPQYY